MDVQNPGYPGGGSLQTGAIGFGAEARIEAYRKLKHLLVISQPSLAQDAEYPRRLYNLATVKRAAYPLLWPDRDGPGHPA